MGRDSLPHSDPHSSPREFTQVEIEQGYEGTPLPHGIACRCSDCAPASSPYGQAPGRCGTHGIYEGSGCPICDPALRST